MKLLVSSAAGLLRTAATPVNLKFAALAGLVGASTVVGAISASSSSEQIKDFLNASFKPVADFMVPIFKQIGTGAKGIGEGFKLINQAYKDKQKNIHDWIKENLKLSKIKEGWSNVSGTISDWFTKAREFIKNQLWEFIRDKVINFFKNWDESRKLIFQFGSFFKESLVPTLKTLFTSEEGGKESRMSQFWNLITSEGGIQTIVDTAKLYLNNKSAFESMNNSEFSRIIDKLLDDHKTFGTRVNTLLEENNLTKEKIINTLDPQGLAGLLGKAERVIEKALSLALTTPLGEAAANSAAKAVAQKTIEWWKLIFKTVVLPTFTTACDNSSGKDNCFKSPV